MAKVHIYSPKQNFFQHNFPLSKQFVKLHSNKYAITINIGLLTFLLVMTYKDE